MNQNKINFIKETKRHKQDVKDIMRIMVNILNEKAANHDDSKLEEPELSKFAEVTPKFKQYAYNSPEYKQALLELGDALKHHYEHNTHHPEFNYLWGNPSAIGNHTDFNISQTFDIPTITGMKYKARWRRLFSEDY